MVKQGLIVAAAALLLASCSGTEPDSNEGNGTVINLTNVSYDPTRELYQAINPAFAADWKAKTGQTVNFQMPVPLPSNPSSCCSTNPSGR